MLLSFYFGSPAIMKPDSGVTFHGYNCVAHSFVSRFSGLSACGSLPSKVVFSPTIQIKFLFERVIQFNSASCQIIDITFWTAMHTTLCSRPQDTDVDAMLVYIPREQKFLCQSSFPCLTYFALSTGRILGIFNQ